MLTREVKDSGIEWIGGIPKDWEMKKVKSFLVERSEKNHPNEEILSLYRDYGVIPKNSRDDNHNVTSLNTEAYKFVRKDNVVINKMKAWQGSLAVSKYQGIISPAYYIYEIKSKREISPEFLHYALRNPVYIQEYRRISAGLRIGQWDLNKIEFNGLYYPIPPFEVQTKIVEFLDEKIKSIDELVLNNQQSIEEFKKYKQSIIAEVVTKGLDSNVEMQESGIEWIGEVPIDWEIRKIGNFFYQVKDKNIDMQEKNLLSLSYGSIIKRDINTADGLLPANFSSYNIVRPGDIVLRMTDLQNDKTSLRTGFVTEQGIITSAYITIRTNHTNIVNPKYIQLLLHSFDIYKGFYGMGSGVRQNVTFNDIKKLPIILPSKKTQDEIVNYVERKVTTIDNLVNEKEKAIEEFERYKKSLIYEYVTGKKEV